MASKTINNKSNNKLIRMTLVIIMVIAIGVLISVLAFTTNKLNEYKKIVTYKIINTSVEIANGNGLNGDRDGLKYGKTTPGGAGTRYLDFNTTEDVMVNIYISGNMSMFLSVDENNFLLKAGTEKKLPVYLNVPQNTSHGFYSGIIKVIMVRP